MPGEEQEDIVMTSTQCNLRNMTCPVSGKPITELADPVRRYGTRKYKRISLSVSAFNCLRRILLRGY